MWSCAGVSVDQCLLHKWWKAIGYNVGDDITDTDSEFTDIRSDGINLFDGTQGATLIGNYFHDFRLNEASADHVDYIQLIQNAGATRQTGDLTIQNNIMDVGTGAIAQGIFTGNAWWNADPVRAKMYYNVNISDNLLRMAHVNCLALGTMDGLTCARNTLIYQPDGLLFGTPNPPRITALDGIGVVMTDNVAAVIDNPDDGSWTETGSIEIQHDQPTQANYQRSQFLASTLDAIKVDGVVYDPAGEVSIAGAGVQSIALDTTPAEITPAFDVHFAGTDGFTMAFVDHTYGPSGAVSAGATWLWDFGDSNTSTSENPTHTYAAGGVYTVTMTVTVSGTPYVTSVDVLVVGKDMLTFDGATGFVETEAYGVTGNVTGSDTAAVSDGAGGYHLDLSGTPNPRSSIPNADLATLLGAENFTLTYGIKTDSVGASGWILYCNNLMRISVASGTGYISVGLHDGAGWNWSLTDNQVDVADTLAHTFVLSLADGTLLLSVDGNTAATLGSVGPLNISTDAMYFASAFSGGCAARLTSFDVDVIGSDYAT